MCGGHLVFLIILILGGVFLPLMIVFNVSWINLLKEKM